MKNIDIKTLQKFQEIVDKFSRGIPLNSPDQDRCTKSKFVHRFSKFVRNKAFRLKIENEIYYALFATRNVLSNGVKKYSHNGIEFKLCHNLSTYSIDFFDEKANSKELTIHFNKIRDIEYEEISLEKYYEIVKLFI